MARINRQTPAPYALTDAQDVMLWLLYFQDQATALSSHNVIDGFQLNAVLALSVQWTRFVDPCCHWRAKHIAAGDISDATVDADKAFTQTSHQLMRALSGYWYKHYRVFEDARKRRLPEPFEELMCGSAGLKNRQTWFMELGFTLEWLLEELPKNFQLHLNLALTVDTQYALRPYYIDRLNSAMRFEAMFACLEVDPHFRDFKDPITYGGTMSLVYDRERASNSGEIHQVRACRFASQVERIVRYVCDDMGFEDNHAAQALTAFVHCMSIPPGLKDDERARVDPFDYDDVL
ncbi:hypothetical protein EV715DRAFT_258143 [Schizophyllum commune]